jgi:hypothetical protein
VQPTHSDTEQRPLDLGELVDLELRLIEDRDVDRRELRMRDEAIAAREFADGFPVSRHAVFRAWLTALRPATGSTPGRKLQASYRLLSWVLMLVGLLSGATAAVGILRYDGRDPVNVIAYLAVFVLLQVLLCLLSVVSMLPSGLRGRLSPLGPLQSLLRELGVRRAGFDAVIGRVAGTNDATLGRLRMWGTIYGEAERWRLFSITQRSAVAFNVGVLGASFTMIAVSALAFSWSTTLDVDAAAMHSLFSALAFPWAWLTPAVPSLELVEASRYFPGGSYEPERLKDWWPFLLAAVTTYGLLPRVLLATLAARRAPAPRAAR